MTEKNKMLPMVCTVCGKTFYAEHPKHPKYCSEDCRNSKIIKNEHVGEKFGKLTIVSDFQKNGRRYAECKCECGGNKTTLYKSLKMVVLLHADVLDVSSYQIELMIMVLN